MQLDRWYLLSCHYLWMHIKTCRERNKTTLLSHILSLIFLRKQKTTLSRTEHRCQWLWVGRERDATMPGFRCTIVRITLHMCSLSCAQLFGTLWTIAHQTSLSMRFSRQEYWSGLPFPPPGDLSNSGVKPASPALAGGFFLLLFLFVCLFFYHWATWEAPKYLRITLAHVFWRFILCYQLPS